MSTHIIESVTGTPAYKKHVMNELSSRYLITPMNFRVIDLYEPLRYMVKRDEINQFRQRVNSIQTSWNSMNKSKFVVVTRFDEKDWLHMEDDMSLALGGNDSLKLKNADDDWVLVG